MSDAWKTYTGAPGLGTPVCTITEVPDGDALCLELAGYPIVLLRFAGELRAFVNACPHQYLPLNHRGDRVLSADKQVLRCTNHGAGFSADTGTGIEGLALGTRLDPIPVHVAKGMVVIGEGP